MSTQHSPPDWYGRPTVAETAPYLPLATIARQYAEAAADGYADEAAELLAAGMKRLKLPAIAVSSGRAALAAIAVRYDECLEVDNPEAWALDVAAGVLG